MSKHEKDNKSNHITKRKRRENLCDMLQRLTKLNDSMTVASRLTMDLTIFGNTPLIIDSEMWFTVKAGRLKSFLTLSKADKSLTAFLVLLKELKEANL